MRSKVSFLKRQSGISSMFVLKAEIDSKEANEWTVQQLVQEREKVKKSQRGWRDLLLVRHAVPKINSLGEKEKKEAFYGFIKELEQLMERAQKNDSQRSTKNTASCAVTLSPS